MARGHHSAAAPRAEFGLRSHESISCEALKGGVGKSTLVANLASRDARTSGKTVLIVELDPQGTLTNLITGLDPDRLARSVGTVIRDIINDDADVVTTAWRALVRLDDPRLPIDDAQRQAWGPIAILPCNLACADLRLPQHHLRVLDRVITALVRSGRVERAWIDFSPTISALSMAGRYAMRRSVGVTHAAKGSVRGIRQWANTLAKIKPNHPGLSAHGVIVNQLAEGEREQAFRLAELRHLLPELRHALDTGPHPLSPTLLEPPLPRRTVVLRAEGLERPIHAVQEPEAQEFSRLLSSLHDTITKEHR